MIIPSLTTSSCPHNCSLWAHIRTNPTSVTDRTVDCTLIIFFAYGGTTEEPYTRITFTGERTLSFAHSFFFCETQFNLVEIVLSLFDRKGWYALPLFGDNGLRLHNQRDLPFPYPLRDLLGSDSVLLIWLLFCQRPVRQ